MSKILNPSFPLRLKDEGGKMKDERNHFIPHPSSFILPERGVRGDLILFI